MEITNQKKNLSPYFWILGIIAVAILSFYLGRKSGEYKVIHQSDMAQNEGLENHQKEKNTFSSSHKDNIHSSFQTNEIKGKVDQSNQPNVVAGDIPEKVYKVLEYVRQNHAAPEGYVGGRVFENREKQLPMNDTNGVKIDYQEWDVNPKIEGQNRGAERMVTSKEDAYYTQDHYQSFVKIKE